MTPKRARSAKLLEEIIEQLSKEEGISNRKIDCILQAVFGQIANDIRKGDLKGSHILYLGKFLVKPYNINKFYQNRDKREEKRLRDGINIENKG